MSPIDIIEVIHNTSNHSEIYMIIYIKHENMEVLILVDAASQIKLPRELF